LAGHRSGQPILLAPALDAELAKHATEGAEPQRSAALLKEVKDFLFLYLVVWE